MSSTLERLRTEFNSGFYTSPLALETIGLRTTTDPLADVDSREGAAAAFGAIYRAVHAEKMAGRRVHLSIAGGRKTMAVSDMAAAQMLFGMDDRLWHLVSQRASSNYEAALHSLSIRRMLAM